jgi:hypothetical protein
VRLLLCNSRQVPKIQDVLQFLSSTDHSSVDDPYKRPQLLGSKHCKGHDI